MSHLVILTLVLNLIAGTTVFLYTLSAYRKYRRPFFRTLLAYILSFNGLVVVYFLYTYILTNVYSSDPSQIFYHPLVFLVLLVFVYLAEIGMTINLYRVVRHLQGETVPAIARWLFALWIIPFVAASAYSLILFFQQVRWHVFYWVHAAWMFSLIIIILTVLITVLLMRKEGAKSRNSIGAFAWIFLCGYSAFAVSYLDYYFFHTGYQKYYDPFIILCINLCPLLWLKFFFEKANAPVPAESSEERLNLFCERYRISKRERDIVAQVMLGKSNKEIEKILFISHNTVKNHLYSVYQKTGVRSRSELIHRIGGTGR